MRMVGVLFLKDPFHVVYALFDVERFGLGGKVRGALGFELFDDVFKESGSGVLGVGVECSSSRA